jgi:hypothetical protein
LSEESLDKLYSSESFLKPVFRIRARRISRVVVFVFILFKFYETKLIPPSGRLKRFCP